MKYLALVFGFVGVVFIAACSEEPAVAEAAVQEDAGPVVPEGMVLVKGGTFAMGSMSGQEDERPVHMVSVDSFYMDATEVTNAEFARFVEATGHKTMAEVPFDPKEWPNADPKDLLPGSLIFARTEHPVPLDQHTRWWKMVQGADWRHPEGPESSIEGKDNHPVVCVSWDDAIAYCKWAGKRLPTEAEWEYAARGGEEGLRYVWGNTQRPEGKIMANIWDGNFPNENSAADGYIYTAPVKTFPINGFGLYDMSGNVWEYVQDWYGDAYYAQSPRDNPTGPGEQDAPKRENEVFSRKVIRGGSFLCNDSYCTGYRPAARQTTDLITTTNHTGFRCVRNVD